MFSFIFFSCLMIFSLKIMLTNQVTNMSRKRSENVFQKNIFRFSSLFSATEHTQNQNNTVNFMTNTRKNESENVFHKNFLKNIFRFFFRFFSMLFFTALDSADLNQK